MPNTQHNFESLGVDPLPHELVCIHAGSPYMRQGVDTAGRPLYGVIERIDEYERDEDDEDDDGENSYSVRWSNGTTNDYRARDLCPSERGQLVTCHHCGNQTERPRVILRHTQQISAITRGPVDMIRLCRDCTDTAQELINESEKCMNCGATDVPIYSQRDGVRCCTKCFRGGNPRTKFPSSDLTRTAGIKRLFGVEVECINEIGERVEGEGFQIVSDGSLSSGGEEHRSLILQGTRGLQIVEAHLHELREHEYRVDKSCGLHVHVDACDLKPDDMINVLSFMRVFDNVFFALCSKERKKSQYCGPLQISRDEIRSYRQRKEGIFPFFGLSRYKGFNVQAYFEHGSFEFRYHQGTIDPQRIEQWILLCLSAVEYGRLHFWQLRHAVHPSPRQLERMMAIVRLPDAARQYFRGRHRLFNKGYYVPKAAPEITRRQRSAAEEISSLASYAARRARSQQQGEGEAATLRGLYASTPTPPQSLTEAGIDDIMRRVWESDSSSGRAY